MDHLDGAKRSYAVLKCFMELRCWYCKRYFVRRYSKRSLTRPVYCDRKCTTAGYIYKPKSCLVCGSYFDPSASNQKYCLDCREVAINEYDSVYKKAHRVKAPWCRMVESAKTAAKKKHVPFDLTSEYIKSIWNNKCPMLGIDLSKGSSVRCDASPSLDRIRPSLGYVKGNVHIISWRANRIKNDGTREELERIARYLRKIGQ